MRTKTRSFPLILIQYMFSNKYTHAHIVQILTVRHFCLPHCVQYHVLTPRHRNIYTYIQSNHFKASLYINMSIFILSSPQVDGGRYISIIIWTYISIIILAHILKRFYQRWQKLGLSWEKFGATWLLSDMYICIYICIWIWSFHRYIYICR